ncbi:hypothetical protein Pelo_15385 [Pelomyxa schiedti]|nr:hypothetical protein Pelo_15385 [Pelomyxa schiedti]
MVVADPAMEKVISVFSMAHYKLTHTGVILIDTGYLIPSVLLEKHLVLCSAFSYIFVGSGIEIEQMCVYTNGAKLVFHRIDPDPNELCRFVATVIKEIPVCVISTDRATPCNAVPFVDVLEPYNPRLQHYFDCFADIHDLPVLNIELTTGEFPNYTNATESAKPKQPPRNKVIHPKLEKPKDWRGEKKEK